MPVHPWRILFGIVLGLACALQTTAAQDAIPHLREGGGGEQLIVDGQPMLLLAGEIGNSSASSTAYLEALWPNLVKLNLNTVLAPVYWELVEPAEGQFDFARLDDLVRLARAHGMRLVLLWFGSWKNSMSSYVPAWVKRDPDRFPRARLPDGTALEILTPFNEANAAADARAFEAMMRHLRDTDGDKHTVVMVQVENEIGMIPEARDYSEAADHAYSGSVPAALTRYLQEHRNSLHPTLRERWDAGGSLTVGSWTDVFGPGLETDEVFMAWHFARYVERVAAAGHAVYPLPLYVNAALVRPGRVPGEYPSAGPLPHLIDVWRAGAPTVDFIAPDIYFPNFVEWVRAFDRPGNPVFIPEAGRAGSRTGAADAFYAIGAHDALGYSPFSIEDAAGDDPLGRAYDVLRQLAPLVLERRSGESMAGMRPPVSFDGTIDDDPQTIVLGGYTIEVSFVDPWTPPSEQHMEAHGGLVLQLGPDTFLFAGTGLTVTFGSSAPGPPLVGIERIEEGHFVDGEWLPGRVLNGDQSHQGRHLRLPPGEIGMQRVTLYRYR